MKVLIVLFCGMLTGCGAFVDESVAIEALEAEGYTNVKCGNSHWISPKLFGCSEDDDAAFDCYAKDKDGKLLSFAVCASLFFKGTTVRHK